MIEKLKPEEVELPTVESMDTGTAEQPAEGGADIDMATPPAPAPTAAPAPNEEGEKMDTPTEGTEGTDQATEGTDQATEGTDQATSEDSSPNLDKKTVSYQPIACPPFYTYVYLLSVTLCF